jgi:hypothetical protein
MCNVDFIFDVTFLFHVNYNKNRFVVDITMCSFNFTSLNHFLGGLKR